MPFVPLRCCRYDAPSATQVAFEKTGDFIRRMRPAVFVDRDGVINVDRGYVARVEDFQFIDGAVAALRAMADRGFRIVVVTNQSGIGRGYYTDEDFQFLSDWMLAELARQGVAITAIYHCPHAPEEDCQCRKPAPGMFLEAAREHAIDLERSWMIGDKPSDVEAAERAGIANTILVRSGQPLGPHGGKALFVCDSISDTVRILCKA